MSQPLQPEPSDDLERENIRALRASSAELQKATIAFEHAALRILLLLNGGAAVAGIAFFGNVAGRGAFQEFKGWAIAALVSWSLGLLAATAATRLGYRSQHYFYKAANRKVTWKVAEYRKQIDNATDAKTKFDADTCKGKLFRRFGHCAETGAAFLFFVGVVSAAVALAYA